MAVQLLMRIKNAFDLSTAMAMEGKSELENLPEELRAQAARSASHRVHPYRVMAAAIALITLIVSMAHWASPIILGVLGIHNAKVASILRVLLSVLFIGGAWYIFMLSQRRRYFLALRREIRRLGVIVCLNCGYRLDDERSRCPE